VAFGWARVEAADEAAGTEKFKVSAGRLVAIIVTALPPPYGWRCWRTLPPRNTPLFKPLIRAGK
jgi:hypothetical protein